MTTLKKTDSNIFIKNIKNNTKLIPFNIRENYMGEVKYFPAASKEWNNSIYYYNNNYIKNLPVHSLNVNRLIRSYFNLYLSHNVLITKYKSPRARATRFSFNKIFVSKSEIKHTNSKAIITIYTYNRERISLIKKINYLIRYTPVEIYRIVEWMFIPTSKNSQFYRKVFKKIWPIYEYISYYKSFFFPFLKKSKIIYKNISYNFLKKSMKIILFKKLILLRRYKLKLNLNKYKYEEKFLYKLSKLISKFYKKKVEFHIINLKSIILNTDIFTEILTLKLKKKRIRTLKMMRIILGKVRLKKIYNKEERSRVIKSIDFNLFENQYKTHNIISIINNNNIDQILTKEYYKNQPKGRIFRNLNWLFIFFKYKKSISSNFRLLKNIFINKIKYKNMAGIRLEVKGRLTKRYRADRALFKVKWKGGLKNLDSSFKGLSTVKFKGFANSNVEYSIRTSKRRIGAFAVKGWISGI